MPTGKNKSSRWGILVLLPVFLLYVNHSLVIYHTHIFSNGVVITHALNSNDCKEQTPAQNNDPAKEQIVVFQGLVLVLNDNPPLVYAMEDDSDFFVRISVPVIDTESVCFQKKKQDRGPPHLSV